jgi:hypothetical protein
LNAIAEFIEQAFLVHPRKVALGRCTRFGRPRRARAPRQGAWGLDAWRWNFNPLNLKSKSAGTGDAKHASHFKPISREILMRKSILSLSVTAALAIPAISVAQQAAPAAPAVPTLDKVLEASGLSVSGYIDTAYQHANRNIEGTNFSPRVFDSQNNSFVLHQFGLQVAKQPKEGFGGQYHRGQGRPGHPLLPGVYKCNKWVDVRHYSGLRPVRERPAHRDGGQVRYASGQRSDLEPRQ